MSCRAPLRILLVSTVALTASAQEPTPTPEPTTQPSVPAQRPGRFRLGPFYLTPYIHIGTLGLDSNVLYTAEERQADFTASGGPGLEIVAPLRSASRLTLDGAVDYVYFARTESQRRWNGYASAQLQYDPGRDAAPDEYRPHRSAFVEESFLRTNSRPSLEVDRRVPRTEEGTRAGLALPIFGRLGIDVGGGRRRYEVDEPVDFVGNDLRRTLTRDQYTANAGLRYSVTIKTSLALRGRYEASRFDLDSARDGDIVSALGGVETERSALIAGHALFGAAWFRRKGAGRAGPRSTEIDVDAMWNVTGRTRLGGGYRRALAYSAFEAPPGEEPTLTTRSVEVRLEKDLGERFDLRFYGRRTRLATTGVITVATDAASATQRRNDTSRQAGGSLGYRFRPRIRVSVDAAYLDRQSNFADFGIEGLLVGFAVGFTPGDIR